VTLDAYEAVHGKEPTEGMNTFGWRELDGLVDNFPTDDSENVFYGDSVPVYDEVHIGPCYSWCVHMESTHRQATHRETSPHTDGDTGNDWKKVSPSIINSLMQTLSPTLIASRICTDAHFV